MAGREAHAGAHHVHDFFQILFRGLVVDAAGQRGLVNPHVAHRVHQQVGQLVGGVPSVPGHAAHAHIHKWLVTGEELGTALAGDPHHLGHLDQHAARQLEGLAVVQTPGRNVAFVEGVHVLSTRQVEDGKAGKAMSLVAAADYYVEFRPGKEPEISWKDKISDFLAQPEITVMKKTKRSEKEIDIRPFIYKMELQGDKIFMMLASASANYTKPELVTDTFFSWLGIELPEFAYSIKRLEVYADKGTEEEHKFVTLEALGEEVE
mgnify:CR=1 FL=1